MNEAKDGGACYSDESMELIESPETPGRSEGQSIPKIISASTADRDAELHSFLIVNRFSTGTGQDVITTVVEAGECFELS